MRLRDLPQEFTPDTCTILKEIGIHTLHDLAPMRPEKLAVELRRRIGALQSEMHDRLANIRGIAPESIDAMDWDMLAEQWIKSAEALLSRYNRLLEHNTQILAREHEITLLWVEDYERRAAEGLPALQVIFRRFCDAVADDDLVQEKYRGSDKISAAREDLRKMQDTMDVNAVLSTVAAIRSTEQHEIFDAAAMLLLTGHDHREKFLQLFASQYLLQTSAPIVAEIRELHTVQVRYSAKQQQYDTIRTEAERRAHEQMMPPVSSSRTKRKN